MTIAFSTAHLHQRDRIPFWVDVASKAFYAHGFSAKPADFNGSLDASTLDSLKLARLECNPCVVTRSRRDASSDGIDDFILALRLTGRSLFSQGERTLVVEPGSVLLMDSGRPQTIEYLEQSTTVCISIPRRELQSRLTDRDAERVLSADHPIAAIAIEFVRVLAEKANAVEPEMRRRLAEQVLDLMSLAFAGEDGAASLSHSRAGALRRLKAQIEKRLTDPSLKPADVAAAAGISVRYANLLLAEEGFSLERYIVHRRLEHCRRALEDPRQGHRMIGEIAYACGFSDHSHFTRRFRAAFGITPGDCRERARQAMLRDAS